MALLELLCFFCLVVQHSFNCGHYLIVQGNSRGSVGCKLFLSTCSFRNSNARTFKNKFHFLYWGSDNFTDNSKICAFLATVFKIQKNTVIGHLFLILAVDEADDISPTTFHLSSLVCILLLSLVSWVLQFKYQ